jgi:phenylpyruvate tautomerase PptA (4-oxalocrotonate tautomerase family)
MLAGTGGIQGLPASALRRAMKTPMPPVTTPKSMLLGRPQAFAPEHELRRPGPPLGQEGVLIPGATYNILYWDFPYGNGSYVGAATAAGYATFDGRHHRPCYRCRHDRLVARGPCPVRTSLIRNGKCSQHTDTPTGLQSLRMSGTRCESRIRPPEAAMPMIDTYASAGTFADKHQLAADLASTLMRIEQVPDIPMFRKNTAAFVHELPPDSLSNVDGDSTYVRVQVLTNSGALDRDKQLKVVRQFTDIIAAAAGDPGLAERTWVLLTEAPDGGWGLAGHANTNAELIAAARAQIAELAAAKTASGPAN